MPNKKLPLYKTLINKELETFLSKKINSEENSILKAHYLKIRDFVLREGKRLRPLISLMAYKAVKGEIGNDIILPAISSELLHAGTLIHDDIMDEDALRRNEPSMHKIMEDVFSKDLSRTSHHRWEEGMIFKEPSTRFGVSMAILQGNILYSLGEKCLHEANIFPDIKKLLLEKYNDTTKIVNEGQILDITFALMHNIGEDEYLEMALKKTARLFVYSVQIGSILAGANKGQDGILTEVIKNIAIAFQINDDILDITNPSEKGHSLGSDIKKGNMTLPIIYALKRANKNQKNKLEEILDKNIGSDKEIKYAIGIIKNSGAISYSEKFANKKIKIARELLDTDKNKFSDLEFFYKILRSSYLE